MSKNIVETLLSDYYHKNKLLEDKIRALDEKIKELYLENAKYKKENTELEDMNVQLRMDNDSTTTLHNYEMGIIKNN